LTERAEFADAPAVVFDKLERPWRAGSVVLKREEHVAEWHGLPHVGVGNRGGTVAVPNLLEIVPLQDDAATGELSSGGSNTGGDAVGLDVEVLAVLAAQD